MHLPLSLRRLRHGRSHPALDRQLVTLRTYLNLCQLLNWKPIPTPTDPDLHEGTDPTDANGRRLNDALVICTACANANGPTAVEIGTANGATTARMARHLLAGTVHTVNIPPEEIADGGKHTTYAPSRDEIGLVYRQQGLTNVRQIFANTRHWKPDFTSINVAFIDGCHDTDFVINDTRKLLPLMAPGGLILWHDFNPELTYRFPWIKDVMTGIDILTHQGLLTGPVYWLQDSWTACYRVPAK